MNNLLAFIGFGEAAYHIAKGLREAGITGMCAYDLQWNNPEFAEKIKTRSTEAGVDLYPTQLQAIQDARFVLSATSERVYRCQGGAQCAAADGRRADICRY
jgi:3-hydroxyisobutyrate dehydrogenase-like beta-hydroxyacid dehydrogenase